MSHSTPSHIVIFRHTKQSPPPFHHRRWTTFYFFTAMSSRPTYFSIVTSKLLLYYYTIDVISKNTIIKMRNEDRRLLSNVKDIKRSISLLMRCEPWNSSCYEYVLCRYNYWTLFILYSLLFNKKIKHYDKYFSVLFIGINSFTRNHIIHEKLDWPLLLKIGKWH